MCERADCGRDPDAPAGSREGPRYVTACLQRPSRRPPLGLAHPSSLGSVNHLSDGIPKLVIRKPSLEDRELLVQEARRPGGHDRRARRRWSKALKNRLGS